MPVDGSMRAQIGGLVIATSLIQLANGFFGTLVSLRVALENFDAIGRWRARDGGVVIDPSGTLPDGRSFKGFKDLQTILKADPRAFTECLTEKMLTYALGRGLERGDRQAVRTIAQRVAADNYRFSSLVLAIVRSDPFQMRRKSESRISKSETNPNTK